MAAIGVSLLACVLVISQLTGFCHPFPLLVMVPDRREPSPYSPYIPPAEPLDYDGLIPPYQPLMVAPSRMRKRNRK